ncbi:MAG: hypothetical protein IT340_15205 [Chloroflexi bacterium]|nr:hypothetical protein [Chloroflexota bacterium]
MTMPVAGPDRQTPPALEQALTRLAGLTDERAAQAAGNQLATQVQALFGADALRAGPDPLVDELTVIWAVAAPGADARLALGRRQLAGDGAGAGAVRGGRRRVPR